MGDVISKRVPRNLMDTLFLNQVSSKSPHVTSQNLRQPIPTSRQCHRNPKLIRSSLTPYSTMSTERHSAYFRVSERVATIRRSGDTLRRRITSSIDRGGLGWKGESARQALAASLSAHYAQSNGDGHRQALHPDDTNICEEIEENIDGREGENREWGRVLELELDGVYERSDSMEPLRHGEGAEEDTTESYAGWHSLNSRKMRKMRLEEVRDMYSRGERFATVSSGLVRDPGSTNGDPNTSCLKAHANLRTCRLVKKKGKHERMH
jgi:hypothetical protein